MPPIVTTAEIGRPAAEVFAYATDPARPWHPHNPGAADGPPGARKQFPANMAALKHKMEAG